MSETTPASGSQTYQGRWGFYPCPYDQYLQLKQLHKLVLQDRRATKRQERWDAKQPENRKGPRPECVGTDHDYYQWILQEYRKARYPKATPQKVQPLDLPRTWQQTLELYRLACDQAA